MTTVLAAAAGGHLRQLWQLRTRLEPAVGDVVWVTWPSPQSDSLLADEEVVWVDYAAPRSLRTTAGQSRHIARALSDRPVDQVVSTGSQIAIAAFAALCRPGHRFGQRRRRARATYIESAARVDGLSVTGRIVDRLPGVRRLVQYPHLTTTRWDYRGSVLDGYRPTSRTGDGPIRTAVVTTGTSHYSFARMVERVQAVLPDDADVLWQLGIDSHLVPGARTSVPAAELADAMARADVVISHAGAGSSITALDNGRVPLLVPREAGHGEHVDDHQFQVAHELERRGLAVVASPPDLDEATLHSAAAATAVPVDHPPAIDIS